MKINQNHHAEVSKLFAARANPWAPKFEPALWNDVSQTAYDIQVKRYEPHLAKLRTALADPLDRPHKLAVLLARYNDDLLQMLTKAPAHEITVMRRNFMHLLDSTCMSTNCYAYMLDKRQNFKPGDLLTPGYRHAIGGDCSAPLAGRNLAALFAGLAQDGIEIFSGDPNRDRAPDGYYLGALLVRMADNNPEHLKDFHFIRYDRDGRCSHKLGHEYASRSYMGRDIIDPTKPDMMPGYRHAATLMVPAVL